MKTALILSTLVLLASTSAFSDDIQPTFSSIKKQILDRKCASCHSGNGMMSGIAVTDYKYLLNASHGLVIPGHADQSKLYQRITQTGGGSMPPGRPLSQNETDAIKTWIDLGAQNN